MRSLVAAVLFATMLAGGAPPSRTLATDPCPPGSYFFRYAGQHLLGSGSNGVDGFIRGSVISNMNDPIHEHVTEWLGLDRFNAQGEVISWVQIGQMQGCAGDCPGSYCIYTPITIHLYAEYLHCTTHYYLYDLAQVPAANYPVYVNYDGSGGLSWPCLGQSSYEFAFRKGSWSNPPSQLGYMQSSIGILDAALEVMYLTTPPAFGRTYFGTDNNKQPNYSYGLNTYIRSTNTWNHWTNGTYPGTTCYELYHSSIRYVSLRTWDAFAGDNPEATNNCPNPG